MSLRWVHKECKYCLLKPILDFRASRDLNYAGRAAWSHLLFLFPIYLSCLGEHCNTVLQCTIDIIWISISMRVSRCRWIFLFEWTYTLRMGNWLFYFFEVVLMHPETEVCALQTWDLRTFEDLDYIRGAGRSHYLRFYFNCLEERSTPYHCDGS